MELEPMNFYLLAQRVFVFDKRYKYANEGIIGLTFWSAFFDAVIRGYITMCFV